MDNFNEILDKTTEEYFYNTFKKFGATDEEIIALSKDHPDLKNKAIKFKLEDKLNILYVFGFDIQEILLKPYCLYKSIASIVCKCEMALLEDIDPNIYLLTGTKHRHIFANYAARKKGYLPANYNIFTDANITSHLINMGKGRYLERFYKNKNIQNIHNTFKSNFPDFFKELITIDEYKYLINEEEKTQVNLQTIQKLTKPTIKSKPNFSVIKRPICYSTSRIKTEKE